MQKTSLITALATILVAAVPLAAEETSEAPHVLHIYMLNRLPTVDALLAGKPVRLVVDLGAYKALGIRPDALADSGITYTGTSEKWRDAEGTVRSARTFKVSQLRAGSAEFSGVEGIEYVSGNKSPDHDGFIGFGLLRHYAVVFDYPGEQIRLLPRGEKGAMPSECQGKKFKFGITNGVVEVPVDTEFGELFFQLDSGSNMTIVHPDALANAPAGTLKPSGITFYLFGLGDFKTQKFRAPLQSFAAPAVDGVLGTSFLEDKVVCLNFDSGVGVIR